MLVTGDSTPGRELAYEFRKATGIGLNFHVLKPGEPIPQGKWLMFDKPPAASDPLFDVYNQWSGKVAGGESHLTTPAALQSFYKGPNLFDALGNTEANGRLAKALKDAVQADPGSASLAPGAVHAVEQSQIDAAKGILSGFDQEGLENCASRKLCSCLPMKQIASAASS